MTSSRRFTTNKEVVLIAEIGCLSSKEIEILATTLWHAADDLALDCHVHDDILRVFPEAKGDEVRESYIHIIEVLVRAGLVVPGRWEYGDTFSEAPMGVVDEVNPIEWLELFLVRIRDHDFEVTTTRGGVKQVDSPGDFFLATPRGKQYSEEIDRCFEVDPAQGIQRAKELIQSGAEKSI